LSRRPRQIRCACLYPDKLSQPLDCKASGTQLCLTLRGHQDVRLVMNTA
jgi:hypothetical protein